MTVETFNASTTWTCPAGVTSVDVECVGGGGGGRGGTLATQQAGGGGGAYARNASVAVTPGNNYTITVGAGGTAGASGGGSGGDGGDTSFGTTTVVADGGKGGTSGGPGAGGLAASSTGTTTTSGTTGQTGAAGGAGGAAAPPLGGAGGAGPASGSQNPGIAPGGGGSGGDGSVAGGAGAAGRVVLTYTAAPAAPTALNSSDITTTSIRLNWTASTGSPTGYDVRVNGGAHTSIGNVLTHNFTGLTPATAYTLEVRGTNAGGASSWATLAESTLPDTAPGDPDYDFTYQMNRIAGTLDANDVPKLAATEAANVYAGTTGHSLTGALNVAAGNTLPNYQALQGVLNQLAGTTGLAITEAAAQIEA
jgi:hypothetical protein